MNQVSEYIGYLASALVLASFVMKNITYLRIVNSFGCACFIIYGVMLGSAPIVVTNASIVLVNLYYLFKSNRVNQTIEN